MPENPYEPPKEVSLHHLPWYRHPLFVLAKWTLCIFALAGFLFALFFALIVIYVTLTFPAQQ